MFRIDTTSVILDKVLTFDGSGTSIATSGCIQLERRASALAAMVAEDLQWRLAFRAGWDAGSLNFEHDRDRAFDRSGETDRVAFIDGWQAREEFDSSW